MVELVELPPHLFEIKGEPVIKADANNDLVEKYLRDLENYQGLVEQREDSSEEVDEAEFQRLNKEFGIKIEPSDSAD